MRQSTKKALFWTPRILAIAFILFLGLFALDVFGEGYSFGELVVAFLMHLVPNFILLAILLVAWRYEWVGSILFVGLGLFYLIWTQGRFPLVTYVAISGPLFLTGALFFLNWFYRGELGKPGLQ
jgi:hypothetical protein